MLRSLFNNVSARRKSTTEVGWILDTEHAGFIWDAPVRMRSERPAAGHAKSVAVCPAVLDHESRLFVVPCPITARLKMTINKDTGEAQLINAAGDQSSIRTKTLGELVKGVAAKEWRHPSRPIIQVITPYVFLSDDAVPMTQTPPFNHLANPAWPGLMIGGRLPQDIDQVHFGQKTVLRFPAFNQRTTPEIDGTFSYVSADLSTDQHSGTTFYKARVAIPADGITRLGGAHLVPGMPVESFVQTTERTVISYLTKPLMDQVNRAFRESR